MSAAVDVLALLRDPHYDLRCAADFEAAATVVAELVSADREYDAAILALRDLNRRIAESGWIEVDFRALRDAGERVVRAICRRESALAKFGEA